MSLDSGSYGYGLGIRGNDRNFFFTRGLSGLGGRSDVMENGATISEEFSQRSLRGR